MKSPSAPRGKTPSVLLVEDDPQVAELLRDVFCEQGWRTRLALNGQLALLALREERLPDVVIADGLMPEMGGPELFHQLRSDPAFAALPTLLMSGSGALLRSEASRFSQATIRKPFDPDTLVALVAQLMAIPSSG